MKIHYIIGYLLMAVILSACNNSPQSTHDAHSHDDMTIPYTGYSESVEIFVDAQPLAVGANSQLIVHITDLKSFKPVDIQDITISLVIGTKGVRIKSESPVQQGIFKVVIQPTTAGAGQLRFEFNKDGAVHQVLIPDVKVYSNEHDAVHLAEEDLPSSPNAIAFTKEQSWKVEFETRQVQRIPFGAVIKVPAKVSASPINQRIVVAKSSGIVLFTSGIISVGQKLNKGEWAFTIAGQGLTENNSVLRLQEAKVEYETAKSDYDRDRRLYEKKIVSERSLLESKARYEKASTQWNNLQSAIGTKGEKVRAPGKGLVHAVHVQNGEFVSAGTPLFTIVENKRMLLTAMVRLSKVAELSAINDATIETNSGEVYELQDLNGRIVSVAQSINEEAYLLPVTIEVDYNHDLLSSGFVNVYLKSDETNEEIVVPETALVEMQGLFFVYVQLTPELFERQQVKPGKSDGRNCLIQAGLTGRERIVTKGATLVKLAAVSNTVDAHAGHVH
ncbi:efflux RND transporter periplasmic adaptor subunit [Carboxylicivirga mesophila]|uniref:Efflux RND transporter periplasmic adaptor subunit n=1 Tax=Carboxylicivirga mesophila TaxID=1166478 RepID=A0ABS5KG22_9BACT|nr:efflux RND transporter periplasmic adaptor subunit [Carboxylicivirga mesophila]MBS2213273.1 efflux RND transporter periplasmic adaptor subunit [Carboxylicivirga mesophila]